MNALQVLLTICRRVLLRTSIVVALGIGLLANALAVSDQAEANSAAFPASEITLVMPYGEGGATDVLFRTIAEQAQTYLEVPVTPVNMPGNGATLGSRYVQEAPADGYTLLGSHQTIDLAYFAGLSDYSHDAFEPVALLTRTVNIPSTYAGHPVTQANHIAAMVEQRPGELLFGIVANSTDNFFWLQFFELTGISADDVQFVRYPDTGAQVVALLGGELDFAMLNLPSASQLFKAGALTPLGVASETRLSALPQVPTLMEQGVELVNTTDRGLFAPLDTPPERLERLAGAFEQALAQPSLAHTLQHIHGSGVDFRPREAYGRYLDEQYQQLKALADAVSFER